MVLTEHDVVPFLLRHDLVSSRCIVDDNITVASASYRNRNFQFISERGPCYFLKQGVNPDGIATVAHEAAVYRLLQANTEAGELHRHLPRLHGYDPQAHVLILELVRNASNLRDYHRRRGRFATGHARAMGAALAALHRLRPVVARGGEDPLGPPCNAPWALSLHRPDCRLLRRISSANVQLIKILQQYPDIGELFDTLRREWTAESLIHSDIKWDNFIVCGDSASGRRDGLKIVDWEMAGPGDPRWDVGSVFNDYLGHWLLSTSLIEGMSPEQLLEFTRCPIERMQPAIRAFWSSYARAAQLDAAVSHQWLLRAIQYGAARLVQTAFESMQMSMLLSGHVVLILQLSLNILKRPREAGVQLLGIW